MTYTAAPTPPSGRPLPPTGMRPVGTGSVRMCSVAVRSAGVPTCRSHPVLAREIGGRYDDTTPQVPPALARLLDVPVPDDPTDPALTDDDRDTHPFGLPVLSEVPQLAMLLLELRKVDRLLSEVVDAIMLLEDTGLAEATTGIGIDTWLSIVGRRTRADTRMLRTTATVMRRIPTLHQAFRTGAVSWAQVRSVVLAVRPLPGHLDDRVDTAVGDALAGAGEAGPDALTRTIRWHLDAIDPTEVETGEHDAERAEYLAMQPRIDGTGGRFWGELGPVNFALLDAAVNTGPAEPPDNTDNTDTKSAPGHAAPTPVAAAGRARLHRLIPTSNAPSTSTWPPTGPASQPPHRPRRPLPPHPPTPHRPGDHPPAR